MPKPAPRIVWYFCSACQVRAVGFIKEDDPEALGYDVYLITPSTCCCFAWYHEIIDIKDCSNNPLMMRLYKNKIKEDRLFSDEEEEEGKDGGERERKQRAGVRLL